MQLGLSWSDTAAVVVSTVGIYVVFLVLFRLFGPRVLSRMSSFDFATAITLGAVMGRAMLGYTPTFLAGVIAMATLFVLQTVAMLTRRTRRVHNLFSKLPLLLMADGRVLPGQLRAARIVEDELRQQLRLAGVRNYDDVAAVILEPTGAISVIRRGETLSADLVADVRGHDLLDRSEPR